MKKKQFVLMLLALATGFTACSSNDDEEQATPQQEQDVFEAIDLTNSNTVLSSDAKKVLARVKVNIYCELEPSTIKEKFFNDSRIYIRSVKCSGFALKGSLNKSSIESGSPVWKDYDGQDELSFSAIEFHDGRKDGKEGSINGEQSDEPNQFLNPAVTENYAPVDNGCFSSEKNPGINEQAQSLFKFCDMADAGGGYYYVIPRHKKMGVDLDVSYYVETIDAGFNGFLSDGDTHGVVVEDKTNKTDILGKDIDFEPGKSYLINIVVGAEAPKIEATTLR